MLPLLASLASAGELVTSFPAGEPVHYRVQMGLKTGDMVQIFAREQIDAMLGDVTMLLLMTCTGEEPGKRDQQVDCAIERAMLTGHGKEREQGEVQVILDEFAGHLSNGTVELSIATTGRIKAVDLEGVPKDDSRAATTHEFLRDLVARGVGPLDIEMPKDGVDPGKAWKQKSAAGMRHPAGAASGSVKSENTVTGTEGTSIALSQTGNGVLETMHSVNNGLGERLVVSINGTATLDTASGVIVLAEQHVAAQWSASASRSTIGFDQLAHIERIDDLAPLIEEFDAAVQ